MQHFGHFIFYLISYTLHISTLFASASLLQECMQKYSDINPLKGVFL